MPVRSLLLVFVTHYPYQYAPLPSLSAILVVNPAIMGVLGGFSDGGWIWMGRLRLSFGSPFIEQQPQSSGVDVSVLAQNFTSMRT